MPPTFASPYGVLCFLQTYTDVFTPSVVWAAKHCSSIDVLTALKQGDDPRQENGCGETALHWAAFYSQSVSTNYLLTYKADPNHRDLSGKTPLHWAFLPESPKPLFHNKVVFKLLKNKAAPNAQDRSGKTPLHYAVIWPVTTGPISKENAYSNLRKSALFYLLSYGANPNIQDENGDTPLHILLREADTLTLTLPILELLLQKGANPSILNCSNERPWDIALNRSSNEQVLELFAQE
jgi:ankyrin repeat protein